MKTTNSFVSVLAVIGGLFLAFVLGMTALMIWGMLSLKSSIQKPSLLNPLKEYTAGIKLEGMIMSDMADEVLKKFGTAQKESNIKAILLEVNSPGGAVVPSQEIYQTILRVKLKKPVVAYVRDVAASGAYYAMVPANRIVVNKASLVGSIGVIFSSVEITKLFETLKIKPVTLKTGSLKDSGSPNRAMNSEDERYLKELIDNTHRQFIEDIKAVRPVSIASMNYMADGRVVLGDEAVRMGLVDLHGDLEMAMRIVAEELGVSEAPELQYLEDPNDWRQEFKKFIEGSAKLVNKLTSTGLGQEFGIRL